MQAAKNLTTLKLLILAAALVAAEAALVACGSGGGGDAATPAPPIPVAQTVCSAGLIQTSAGCLATAANCTAGYGYNPTTTQCLPPITTTTGTLGVAGTGRWGAPLAGINSGTFVQMLTAAGMCPYNIISFGSANCSNYTNQGYIIVIASGSGAQVQIGAGVSNPNYANIIQYASGGGNGTYTVSAYLQISTGSLGPGTQLSNGYLTINSTQPITTATTLPLTILYNGSELATANAQSY